MSIQAVNGMKAYANALADFQKAQSKTQQLPSAMNNLGQGGPSFGDTLRDSLSEVNAMQGRKDAMVTSFAAGETQNVHELMITMQKAGLAINLTSSVRNKVLEAYRELSRLQF